MKKTLLTAATLAALSYSALAAALATAWKIAPGYAVTFATKDAEGSFNQLKGEILFDPNDLVTSRFNVALDVASINTGNGLKNRHAKSAKWFDAAAYPEIKFSSTRVQKTATGYEALGSLTMHGVSRDVALPFTFTKAATGGSFSGHLEVNREDFKIGEPNKVGDIVKIDLKVPVTN